MTEEQRPLRQLGRIDRLLVRLDRCPTCRGRLKALPTKYVTAWTRSNTGLGSSTQQSLNPGVQLPSMTHVDLHNRKIPHCPECQHTFMHGWIYPVDKQEDEHNE